MGKSTASDHHRASDPHRPPPVPAIVGCDVLGTLTWLLLLALVEVGAGKARMLDGALLACCAQAERADRAADAVMDRLDIMATDDPAFSAALAAVQPLFGAYRDAVERAAQLPARSPDGLRRKATLLLLHIGTGQDHTALAASLARDVAGRA